MSILIFDEQIYLDTCNGWTCERLVELGPYKLKFVLQCGVDCDVRKQQPMATAVELVNGVRHVLHEFQMKPLPADSRPESRYFETDFLRLLKIMSWRLDVDIDPTSLPGIKTVIWQTNADDDMTLFDCVKDG